MKFILALTLSLFAFTANASLFKTTDSALACKHYDVLSYLVYSVQRESEEVAMEKIDYAVSQQACVYTKPNIIVRVLNFEGDLYFVEAINLSNTTFWIHKNQLR